MKIFFSFLMLVSVLSIGAACGPLHPHRAHRPPGSREPPVTQSEAGPERAASNSMIEEGCRFLDAGSYDRAGDTFQEAVNVDPANGAGYYWLAVVKFRVGEYGPVWGLLERAESLLGSDPSWMEKIEELKKELQGTKPDW